MGKVRYRDAPHPLREFFLLFAVTFVLMMALAPFTQGTALRGLTICFGGSMILIGLSLITNLGGATSFYSDLTKTRAWFGVDYSNSAFSRPPFIRVAGAAFVVGGLFFVENGVNGPL